MIAPNIANVMKYESRRYNAANETSKQFYIRRSEEMKKVIESEAWKKITSKWWAEYKKVNSK